MNKAVVQYRKRLASNLSCGFVTRKALLASFDRSMRFYLEENPEPREEDIVAAFGTPEEMAWVLMEGISNEEIAKFYTRQAVHRVGICILIMLLLILCVYGYLA